MKRTVLLACIFTLGIIAGFPQKVLVLQPGPADGKDAYINSLYLNDPGGPNEGLMACAWTFSGQFGAGRSLIRFDLSQIPPGALILDARLTLYYDSDCAFGEQYGANASYLEKIIQDWSEMTVTWATKPLSTSAGAVYIPETQYPTQDIADIDISGLVTEWVLHPETNFGFVHRMANETEYCCLVYSSSDRLIPAKRPKLVVTYIDCDPPLAGFTWTVDNPGVSFTDTSTSASSWFWDFGDGYFSDLPNPQHTYGSQGKYNVCLTVQDSCGSDTVCREISVCDMPAPRYTCTKNALTATFRDSSLAPLSWFWDFGDGFYSDLRDPVHTFNKGGTYHVCEQVTNACGTETYCDSLQLYPAGMGGIVVAGQLTIYPNPASDWVCIEMQPAASFYSNIEVLSVTGNAMITEVIRPGSWTGKTKLDVHSLPTGVYMVRVKGSGACLAGKLVIR